MSIDIDNNRDETNEPCADCAELATHLQTLLATVRRMQEMSPTGRQNGIEDACGAHEAALDCYLTKAAEHWADEQRRRMQEALRRRRAFRVV